MLQHTLARAELLCPPERQVTVISQAHLDEALPQIMDRPERTMILQPENRDTGAGVFLPLTHIRARDPRGTVVIYPSDHFICPNLEFAETVAKAVKAAEHFTDRLVLLGVAPDRPEPDYGWVRPGSDLGQLRGQSVRSVLKFVEKPPLDEAETLMAEGGLWNTMIVAAKVEALWQLGRQHFPEIMVLFERLERAIGTPNEEKVMLEIYREMPVRNFSSGLLASAADKVSVIELTDVLWSDWGNAERIAETLRLIGKQPAFPEELLEPSRTPVYA